MEPTNRIAAILAALDAERAAKPKKTRSTAKPKPESKTAQERKPKASPKPEPDRSAVMSYLFTDGHGGLINFEVSISDKPMKLGSDWSKPTQIPVGWICVRVVK